RNHPGLHHLVADRPCPPLFHTWEQKNGLLESRRSFLEQDGADAVQDGANAQSHGAPRLSVRSALERQPRLRRVPHGNLAAARGGADRISGFPRSPASRQGQGRVRPVHGAASAASDPTAPGRSAPSLTSDRYSLRRSAPVKPDGDTTARLPKQTGGFAFCRKNPISA